MILPFIISGLVEGAVFGLAGVGLVLTYKTSRVFNFAYGAVAAIAAYVFYVLNVEHGVNWPVSAAVSVVVVALPVGAALERMAKVVSEKRLAQRVLVTVGFLLIVTASVTLLFGTTQTRIVPVFVGGGEFTIGSTHIQYFDLITFVFASVATLGLYLYFRFTRTGVAMRAVVEGPELVELAGTSATRIRRYAWFISTGFAAAVGVLFAPLVPLDSTGLTLLVVPAFAAAAIGAFTNLPMTFLGGLLVGVLEALSTKYFTTGVLAGLPPALPFVLLVLVLLVFPRKYLVERANVAPLWRPTWSAPRPAQAIGGVVVLGFLAAVPAFAGIHLTDWTIGVADIILFLSLGWLLRTAGQVSLCQVTFLAIGVTAFGHLLGAGVPWLIALAAVALIALPIGALLAIPAIRLSPLYLALATFGFGIVVEYLFYSQSWMFGVFAGVTIRRPTGFTSDNGYYYLVLLIAAAACLLVVWLERSRLGRLLRGLGDSPTAVATSGTATRVTWVLAFAISAALACVSGAVAGGATQLASGTSYQPLESLFYLAIVVVVGGGTPWYAVLAGVLAVIPTSYIQSFNAGTVLQLVFGAVAVLCVLTPESRRAVPPAVQRIVDSAFRRREPAAATGPGPQPVETEFSSARGRSGGRRPALSPSQGLEIRDVSVRFGGVTAVDKATLHAPGGQITGLIGPNGAGKTTIFNVCSGLIEPASGEVLLDGRVVTRETPASRARRGLGRTFQRMELFESLSVAENVALGAEGSLAGTNPWRHVIGKRSDGRRVSAAAAEAMELCDIQDLARLPAGVLSTGQRRLVELARCLAGPFGLLLLDEPSSGLNRAETARFGNILTRVVAERGLGILLVEHDMPLVMEVCDHIHCLDFGIHIFEGSAAEVQASPVVRAAYLGDREVENVVAAAPPNQTARTK